MYFGLLFGRLQESF